MNRNRSSYEVPRNKDTYEGATLTSKLSLIIAHLSRIDAFNDAMFTQDLYTLYSSAHLFLRINIPCSELTYKDSLLMRWSFMVLTLAAFHFELQREKGLLLSKSVQINS